MDRYRDDGHRNVSQFWPVNWLERVWWNGENATKFSD